MIATADRAGNAWGGEVPIVVLVRRPAAIPTAPPVQSTDELDWGNLRLELFADEGPVEVLLRMPEDPDLHRVVLDARELEILEDPLRGRVEWAPQRR